MSDNTAVRAAKLDKIFGTPVCAVLLAIFCNVLWGSAFPFIKLGYRLFSIDSGNTASIFCFAGVRFMLGSVLVLLGSILLQGKAPRLPRGRVAAECCALGLWQTTAQYAFYYIAVAMLTGAFGGILNSTQSFLGVIFAHFIYGNADRMIGDDGKPFTPHTTNPVPFVVVGYPCKLREGGKLGDIAPTMLEIMHLPQPPQMTGKSLIEK